jgi:hypothetical protein
MDPGWMSEGHRMDRRMLTLRGCAFNFYFISLYPALVVRGGVLELAVANTERAAWKVPDLTTFVLY